MGNGGLIKPFAADHANLFELLYDWPGLEHHLRHRCGYVLPAIAMDRACKDCIDGMNINTYIDVWVWT